MECAVHLENKDGAARADTRGSLRHNDDVHLKPYPGVIPRPDVRVSVERRGESGVTRGGSSWLAIHEPLKIQIYISFNRAVADNEAVAQLLTMLDRRVRLATAEKS